MCIYMAARLKHKDRRRRERPTDEGLWSGGGVPFFSLSLSPCVPKFYFLLKLALGKGGKKKKSWPAAGPCRVSSKHREERRISDQGRREEH